MERVEMQQKLFLEWHIPLLGPRQGRIYWGAPLKKISKDKIHSIVKNVFGIYRVYNIYIINLTR